MTYLLLLTLAGQPAVSQVILDHNYNSESECKDDGTLFKRAVAIAYKCVPELAALSGVIKP